MQDHFLRGQLFEKKIFLVVHEILKEMLEFDLFSNFYKIENIPLVGDKGSKSDMAEKLKS